MNHWLAVTTPENWDRCKATQTWGVTDDYVGLIKEVEIGDKLLVYIKGLLCPGIFEVTEPYFCSEDPIWDDDAYPHRIRFKPLIQPEQPEDIRQFYYQFFSGLSPAGYFRRGFRRLPEEEFNVFWEFLEKGHVESIETLVPEPEPATETISLSLERDLEEYLERNLNVLEPGLKMYVRESVSGRQYGTEVSRIDLLAQDKENGFVVVELKAGEADRSVLGQILPYMGWVRTNVAQGKPVRGYIVASDFSPELVAAMSVVSNVKLVKYSVTFGFKPEIE